MSVLACLALLLFGVNVASAQSGDRRGEPNVLSTGYYVVDSDDDAPLPWRPNYFFVDTNYQPVTWRRIANGPRQFASWGNFFFNPNGWNDIANMDTSDNAMAGPIPIGFKFAFYDVEYDSVYVSSNGFIGFRPWTEAVGGSSLGNENTSYVARQVKNFHPTDGPSFTGGPPAIIAALWADLDMRPNRDSTRVYYRTSLSLDTFMVNYYNMRLRPGSPNVGVSGGGSDKIFIRKMQIVLARTDSSIQINYGQFSGAINNFPPILAWRLFQNNSSIGVVNHTKTEATSVLFKNKWNAINAGCPNCNKNFRQAGQWAVKFKQWKNVVRAVNVVFPTRNYEICLGTATPAFQATFRNVDLKPQSFKVRFSVRNVVTGIAVYGRGLNLVNVPAGKDTTVSFPAYATNPNILSQLGTFRACAIATTFDTSDVNIGDRWPFDDTTCVRIFGLRRTAQPFNDASNNYSVTSIADIPDQHKWISIGAQVVDGEETTFDPPPPRDLDGAGYGPRQMKSPVIRLDRNDIEGNTYAGSNVGDTLISFPINLQGATKAGITYSYQRTGRTTYPWLFDADVMYGPEHTVLNILGNVMRRGDSMVLEFKKPTEPGCNPSAAGWNQITAVDGGHDFEFQKFFANIQNYNRTGLNYFTADFRFRLRLKAKYDGAALPPPTDDEDAWFIDNLAVQTPRKPEIEVLWVRVVSPYTKMPASQAVSLPVYVKIANNALDVAVAFPIRVQIVGPDGETKYWQTQTVTSIKGGTDSVIQMPNWNAQAAGQAGGQEYVIHAAIAQEGYDSYEDDNATYTKFNLMIEQEAGLTQEFAYDDAGLQPQPNEGNDWPAVTQITGRGVGFNNNSGSFATKFKLATKDTIYGVRVYFSNGNQAPDEIRISLLEGNPNAAAPGDLVQQQGVTTVFEAQRKGDFFNKFWPYYFPKPIVLPGGVDAPGTQGVYWMSISQLGLDNMMMGADLSKGGGLIRVYDAFTPQIIPLYRSKYGTQASMTVNNGDVSSAWAAEVTAGTGNWAAWMPQNGWWPTMTPAGLPLQGSQTNVNPTYMIWGGSYTPMIRPLVSRSIMLPVEFAVPLKGVEHDGKALLTWTTANEKDNMGFYVERQDANVSESMWEKVGFVGSKTTNSSTPTGYSYVDANVTPGTYNYRLIQSDVDGTESVSNVVKVGIGAPSQYSLSAAFPNPVRIGGRTEFSVTMPVDGHAVVEIFNAVGQVVKSLHNGSLEAGAKTFQWNGQDDNGNQLAAGTYLVRVTSGTYTEMMKVTLQ
jgi:hypothetical protein